MCKWWNEEHQCCFHPNSPQSGDCDWYLENCPYEEQDDEEQEDLESINDSLIDFLIMVITNSHKCQHCVNCFNSSACINAYHCIGNDFADYDEGDD